jgi:membrane fusion protein (multidrug efflux system)
MLLAAVGAWIYHLHARQFESTDDAFIDGDIVQVSPRVSGLISAVHVDENDFVHKGDLLVELDPQDFKISVDQARAAEETARGKWMQAKSGVSSSQSAVAQAQAELDASAINLENAQIDLHRYQGLDEGAKSQQQLDTAVATEKRAKASLTQAKARLTQAQAQVGTANAEVAASLGSLHEAQASTRSAEVSLGYCRLVAPCDGHIANKTAEVGMVTSPASALFQIIPPNVWVTANFKETQLDRIRIGQPVSISVDAYPELKLRGKVNSFQAGTGSRFSIIPSENATGNFVKVVQRVPVKITIDYDSAQDPARELSPGMSVIPTVRVADR